MTSLPESNPSERQDELEQALLDLDGPIAWIAENYPAAITAMPTEYFRAIRRAGEVLADSNPSNCSIATGGSGCFARWRQQQRRYLYDQWGFRIAHCYRTEPHTWHRWTGGNEDLTCPGLPGAGE